MSSNVGLDRSTALQSTGISPAAPVPVPAAGGAAILARLRAQRAATQSSGTTISTNSLVPETAADSLVAGASPPPPASGPLPAAGGAAILARLRAQRASKAPAAPARREVVVLYASQLGTAQEIAKNIHAEAESRGFKTRVASMNEYGFEALKHVDTSVPPPVIVMVASSTGDGDPPDTSAKFYSALKRRSNEQGMLRGVRFTCMGLGDSNYTRFMQVPRTLKARFVDLGAEEVGKRWICCLPLMYMHMYV
jgi:sulfite reductase alpha subunit-like flavoprotein